MEKVCSKNHRPASMPRRPTRAGAACGDENRAVGLVVLGCAYGCDRCGQEWVSRWGRRGIPPHSGHIKPPQKVLAFFYDSARVGFSGRRSYRASVYERPASAGFSFLGHREFLQVSAEDAQNRTGPDESARIFFTRQASCNLQVFFPSYTTMTKESRGTSASLC
jgi:hypothetical protein